MLRGLCLHVTEDDIRWALEQLQGPQPVDVRLMKKRTGECCSAQNKLAIQGKSVTVHYSNRRQKCENWLCCACGLYNFRKRLKCFRCGAAKVDGDAPGLNGLNVESQQTGDYNGDTLILRNISALSTVEGILNVLAPYANLSAGNIRLIKDKQTGQNRGFAFVQLSSPLEASQLLTILQSLQPPLKLDGKTIGVDYAKSARKDAAQPDGIRASALSVASTAIAAAQWSSTQNSASSSDHTSLPEGFTQQTQVWRQQQQVEALAPVVGDGLLGAAPGMKMLIPAAPGVVLSQTAQVYQPVIISQPATQYDESSGYYYDPRLVCTMTPAASTITTPRLSSTCTGTVTGRHMSPSPPTQNRQPQQLPQEPGASGAPGPQEVKSQREEREPKSKSTADREGHGAMG
ncbi:hypothetical protein INR49_022818 [Caranx melampygus]|nr:hypothetical protein INR49_022818 [Caranx melampygus]